MKHAKLYLFYLCSDKITNELYPTIDLDKVHYNSNLKKEYVLYAYTLDKELARIFRNWRDSSLFIEKKVKVNIEWFHTFSNKHHELYIHDGVFPGKMIDESKDCQLSNQYRITCTLSEYNYIHDKSQEILYDKLSKIKELYLLMNMNDLFKNATYNYIFNEIYPTDILVNAIAPVDYSDEYINSYAIDELQMFIETFGITFKRGGCSWLYGNSIDEINLTK